MLCVEFFEGRVDVFFERKVEDFLHVFDREELHCVFDLCWDLIQINFIAFGDDDSRETCSVGCEDLRFDASNGKDATSQSAFSCHGCI